MNSNSKTALALGISTFLLSAALTGCGGGGSESDATPVASKFEGIWERQGYGDVYAVSGNKGKFYQYTSTTCLLADDGDAEDLAELFDGSKVAADGTSLTLSEENGGAFPVTFTKRTALPAQCEEGQLITQTTPTKTFEHFTQTYADYYAFFNERDVDWTSRVADAETLVHDNMSDDKLFELMAGLLEPLDDGHVQLEGNGDLYRPAQDRGANQIVLEAFEQQSDYTDIQSFANDISMAYWENLGDYLDEGSVQAFDGAIPDRVIWGTMGNGTVGYLYIASMAFFSDEDDGLSETANTAAIKNIMADVMVDLGNTQAMIIDVRKNIGGHDTVSKAIASHFIDQTTLYGSKLARSYMGDTAIVESYMEPASASPYLNPVAVIAGVQSASAAESFTLAMKSLPQVTLVGENTNGILSDVLEKTLPNGWEIWLANEVYFDHLGENHEVTGITPDVEAPAFSLEAIEEGNNAAIDAALTALGY